MMVENKPHSSGGRNQEKALELDRTHIKQSIDLCCKACPHLESSKPKEKRKTLRRGIETHEKNEKIG